MGAKKDRGETSLCECGCGQLANIGKRFISGHNSRIHHPMQGKHRTEQTRRKMSITRKERNYSGANHPMYGKHPTQEARRKMSRAAKKRFADPRNHPMYGKHLSKEAREKISRTAKKRLADPRNNPMYGRRGKLSPLYGKPSGMKGKHHSEEAKRKIGDGQKGMRNHNYSKLFSQETRRKMSEAGKRSARERWRSPEYIEKYFNGITRKPNKPETLFDSLSPLHIRYTGDGSWWRRLIISLPNGEYIATHKNPDFKVTGRNKVIEVFGTYWHRDEFPQDLIEAYKHAGIECLVIWEHELYEKREEVLDRLGAFVGEESWQMSLALN